MARKKKNPAPPVLTLLIGAAVIGGGIYWWNKREDEKEKEAKKEKVKKAVKDTAQYGFTVNADCTQFRVTDTDKFTLAWEATYAALKESGDPLTPETLAAAFNKNLTPQCSTPGDWSGNIGAETTIIGVLYLQIAMMVLWEKKAITDKDAMSFSQELQNHLRESGIPLTTELWEDVTGLEMPEGSFDQLTGPVAYAGSAPAVAATHEDVQLDFDGPMGPVTTAYEDKITVRPAGAAVDRGAIEGQDYERILVMGPSLKIVPFIPGLFRIVVRFGPNLSKSYVYRIDAMTPEQLG